jgi:hypothetical protein
VPKQTNNTIAQVIKAPRFAGDRKPKQANAGTNISEYQQKIVLNIMFYVSH